MKFGAFKSDCRADAEVYLQAEAAGTLQSHERHVQRLQDSCYGKLESLRLSFAQEAASAQTIHQQQVPLSLLLVMEASQVLVSILCADNA